MLLPMLPFMWAALGSEIVPLLDLGKALLPTLHPLEQRSAATHSSYGHTRTVLEAIVGFISLSSSSQENSQDKSSKLSLTILARLCHANVSVDSLVSTG